MRHAGQVVAHVAGARGTSADAGRRRHSRRRRRTRTRPDERRSRPAGTAGRCGGRRGALIAGPAPAAARRWRPRTTWHRIGVSWSDGRRRDARPLVLNGLTMHVSGRPPVPEAPIDAPHLLRRAAARGIHPSSGKSSPYRPIHEVGLVESPGSGDEERLVTVARDQLNGDRTRDRIRTDRQPQLPQHPRRREQERAVGRHPPPALRRLLALHPPLARGRGGAGGARQT